MVLGVITAEKIIVLVVILILGVFSFIMANKNKNAYEYEENIENKLEAEARGVLYNTLTVLLARETIRKAEKMRDEALMQDDIETYLKACDILEHYKVG